MASIVLSFDSYDHFSSSSRGLLASIQVAIAEKWTKKGKGICLSLKEAQYLGAVRKKIVSLCLPLNLNI